MRNPRQEAEDIRLSLADMLMRQMPQSGDYSAGFGNIATARRNTDLTLCSCICQPLVLLIVQGGKSIRLGNRLLDYAEGQYMLTDVDMPAHFRRVKAAPGKPYLSVRISLDRQVIGQLITEMPKRSQSRTNDAGMGVENAPLDILKLFQRMVELLDKPEDQPILGPLFVREFHYRLLAGSHGDLLRRWYTPGSQNRQIVEAISWVRKNFNQPLNVCELAHRVNLSESTLHRWFRKATTLSPVQYQKQLRLHEAQRLMLLENQDANTASLAVGYESPHQFSREYKRLFGCPPRQDINRLRSV